MHNTRLFVLLGVFSAALAAQTFRGGLAGTVADTSGAAVPDVSVKIENKATGLSRSQNSTQAGDFNFPDLPTGVYTVSVTKTGFQNFVQDVEVAVGRVSSVTVTLGVAQQTQTVEVQAAAAALETNSTSLNAVISTRSVQELSLIHI